MTDYIQYEKNFCTPQLKEFYDGKYSDCTGNVLEIGSGPGNWTEAILKKTEYIDVVETNNLFCQTLQNKFGTQINIHSCELSDFIPETTFETVIAHNVIQYLDVKQFFRLCEEVEAKNIIISGHGYGYYFCNLFTLQLRKIYHAFLVCFKVGNETVKTKNILKKISYQHGYQMDYYELGNHPMAKMRRKYCGFDYFYYAKFSK